MKNMLTLLFILSLPLILVSQQGIIYDDNNAIMRIQLDGSNQETVIQSPSIHQEPFDIEVDTMIHQLFWSDEEKRTIVKSNLDGSNESIIFTSTTYNVRGLALDESAQRIYWIEGPYIKSSDYDGSNIITNIDESFLPSNNPIKHLEIDYTNGKLYWSQDYYINGTNTRSMKINCANTDGTSKATLATVNSSYKAIMGLELDLLNNKIYFVDYTFYTTSGGIFGGGGTTYRVYIRKMDLDGSNYTTFKTYLNFYETHVSVDASTGNVLAARQNSNFIIYDTNGNELDNITNSDISQPREVYFNSNDQKIYYVDQGSLKKINSDGSSGEIIKITDQISIKYMQYNESTNWVYWLDDNGYFARVKPDGTNYQMLQEKGFENTENVYSFVVHPMADIVYWTEETAVYSMELDGNNKQQLVSYPAAIACTNIKLDPNTNKLYFYSLEPGGLYKIQSVNTDGTGFTEIISDLGTTSNSGLTLHLPSGKMYWTDLVNDIVKVANLDGTSIKDFYTIPQSYNVKSMASSQDKIYWILDETIYFSSLDANTIEFVATNTTQSYMGYSFSVSDNTALPVELESFTGTQVKNENHLKWNTLSETNNHGFEIERSADGILWDFIGFKEGVGNTSQETLYQFIDERPLFGDNYYRLRQVDFNGDFEYSNTILIQFETRIKIHLSPVPTKDILTISFPDLNEAQNVSIQLVDVSGRILIRKELEVSKNGTAFEFDVSQLPPGNYFAVALIGNSKYQNVQKFMIIHD